jgi:hypothetical protein
LDANLEGARFAIKPGKLAGKILMIVEAFTQKPVTVWYQEDEKCNDQIWCEELLN